MNAVNGTPEPDTGTRTAAAETEHLWRRRRLVDLTIYAAVVVTSTGLWLFVGTDVIWLVTALVSTIVLMVAVTIRSRLTRAIHTLDPPTEHPWKRSWPDGT